MSVIQSFIDSELTLIESVKGTPRLNGFKSLNEFLKKHGRHWNPKPLPDGIKKQKSGQCFMNAQKLATEDSRFVYCEGLAIGVIPVWHGWCVNSSGDVIDPTWASLRGIGGEYFGIAINTKYVVAHLLDTEEWGSIIDDWKNGWQLVKEEPHQWRHPWNDL